MPPSLTLTPHLNLCTGHDTKIFMNATQPPSKRSRVERSVDRIILFMFGLLFSMCLTGCIYFSWWTTRVMPQHWYLAPFEVPTEYESDQPVVVAVTNFITSFILYGVWAHWPHLLMLAHHSDTVSARFGCF